MKITLRPFEWCWHARFGAHSWINPVTGQRMIGGIILAANDSDYGDD